MLIKGAELRYEKLGYEEFNDYHPLSKILSKIIKKEPVLDVACGNGVLLRALKQFDIEGFDPSSTAINEARKMKTFNVKLTSIKSFKSNRKYGSIIMVGILILLKDPIEDIKRMMKFLREDGEMIVSVPNTSSIKDFFGREKDPLHIFSPTYSEFNNLLEENNLKVKKIIGAGRLKYFPILSGTNIYIISK